MNEDTITKIYCDVDDFCKALEDYCKTHCLPGAPKNSWFPASRLSLSEVMTIILLFHLSGYRCFKWYYQRYVCLHLLSCFPTPVSYNRFVELTGYALLPLLIYTRGFRRGKSGGVSFIDSTPLKVCHNRRIYSHKVFKSYAARGKSSTGWFYGFKLHLVINDCGEICSFCLTSGNVDDRNMDVIDCLCRELKGKLFGDRGYICRELFESLYKRGIQLITRLRKNMKNKLMDMSDKLLLRKRAVIESVNDFLKNICQVEHSRHRSPVNFLVNLLAALSAYSFLPRKPSIRFHDERVLPLLA
ncbi:MAG: IS982 family transposase [Spirochaetaceae bacterium]|jgi:hypothetical protein|nr:IS982 family transposase [Spirochaetaceae bacterium]